MKTISLSLLTVWLLCGCAAYKQLEPKPDLSPSEGSYIELKRGEKDFVVKEGKKYFIAFPAPAEKNFYLVLETTRKPVVEASFTASFADQKPGSKIKDESSKPAAQYAYPVDNSVSTYYWLIDGIRSELPLPIKYRYVPQWRFKFENKYAAYQIALRDHQVDRKLYLDLGAAFHFQGNFDFKTAIDTATQDSAELQKVQRELNAIQSIFPSSISNSSDKAYQDYVTLKKSVEEELDFQSNYLQALGFFKREIECRGNPLGFLDGVNDFTAYFEKKERLPANVAKESQGTLEKRLKELVSFYDGLLIQKIDAAPFDSVVFRLASFYRLNDLYKIAAISPTQEFSSLDHFIREFDEKSRKLAAAQEVLATVSRKVKELNKMPEDGYFAAAAAKIEALVQTLPAPLDEINVKYLPNTSALKYKEALDRLRKEAATVNGQYLEADNLVRQINLLKKEKDYSAALGLLKEKLYLNFLIDKYRGLDQLSVETQSESVKEALGSLQFSKAEAALSKLHRDKNFLDMVKIQTVKNHQVEALEDSLYTQVDRVTRQRVNNFCDAKVNQLENVDSLYADSVFLPAHDISFTSGGKASLAVRKDQLIADLAKLKENEFPARAIKMMYEKFMQNPEDSGVYKARAIVTHGRHYTIKEKDKEIEMRVAECDPTRPKWIVKPTEYRRVFALPVTDKLTGKNRYMVRLNIRIPSDAKFPVYDINVRLPKEVAQNAADSAWYEKMSLNGKLLKNEGRFSITAPTAANNYESQITPVQVDKEGNNVFELQFQHRSFKVLPVSVMVQKPIIKKN